MKIAFSLFLMLWAFGSAQAQPQSDPIYSPDQVDKLPEYPGGNDKFLKFVGNNFRLPESSNFNGKVITEFVVEIDGSLSNFKTIQNPGEGTAAEAIRIAKISAPWSPALKDGKPVRCTYRFPVSIRRI